MRTESSKLNLIHLEAAIRQADASVLLAVLAHTTEDPKWLEEPYRALSLGVPNSLEQSSRIRSDHWDEMAPALIGLVGRAMRTGRADMVVPSDDLLAGIMRNLTGESPTPSYIAKVRYDLGLNKDMAYEPVAFDAGFRVLIMGAGLAGISLAMRLRALGVPFHILEKNRDVGGVWFDNSYPDCGCDGPSQLYQFSNSLNPDWSRHYARRDEVLNYIRSCVEKAGLLDAITFDAEVRRAVYDSAAQGWRIEAAFPDGSWQTYDASILVGAVGRLNRPKLPVIAGMEDFGGAIFHTASWRHDVDLFGKRVGIIGNGSSGVQVARSVAAVADHLAIFQRSPHWIKRNPQTPFLVSDGVKLCLRYVPFYAEWWRILLGWQASETVARYMRPLTPHGGLTPENQQLRAELETYIRSQIGDRSDLLEKVLPQYPPYTKRLVVDNDWYATLLRPNVDLVTDPIDAITTDSVVTADGSEHQLDVLICATGFHNTRFLYPIDIQGRDGRTPAEVFGGDDEVRAYLGMTIPGFPNFFSMSGPNGVQAGGTAIDAIEAQADYITRCVTYMASRGLGTIECKLAACSQYNEEMDRDLAKMPWTRPEAGERYLNRSGRVVTSHPWTVEEYWTMTRSAAWSDGFVFQGSEAGT